MALSAPKLTKQRVMAAKIETTTGTAIALTAADGVFNIFDPTFEPDVQENKRPGQSALSPLASVSGARSGRLKFKTELYNAASTPPWASTLLVACGFVANTGVYSPATGSASAPTLTMGFYEDGVLNKIAGAMGNFTITGEMGKPVMVEWDFLGTLQDEADVALIAPTYPTALPPVFMNSALTLGSYTPLISRFSITPGNVLALREDVTSTTGYLSACIVDRDPQATLDPEKATIATRAWQALQFANTTEALSIPIGSGANNVVTIAAPCAQVVQGRPGDRGGKRIHETTLRLSRSAAAGDDEMSLTLS